MVALATHTSQTGTNPLNYQIIIPTSVHVGDLMLFSGVDTRETSPPTPPSGWSLIGFAQQSTGSGDFCKQYVWYRVATSGDVTGSTTVSFTPSCSTFIAGSAALVVYRGQNVSPIDQVAQTASSVSASSGVSPAVTPSVQASRIVQFWGQVGKGSFTPGITTPATSRVSDSSSFIQAIAVSDQVGPAAGSSSGTTTATFADSSSAWCATTLAIIP